MSKSDKTRQAILAAARTLFAERGFAAATVRDIAALAGSDPALVVRYFGGKEALFAQAATFDLNLPDLAAVPHAALGRTLVRHFLAVWEGAGGTGGGLPIALRSAASNEMAAERLRSIFREQVAPALARIAGPDTPRIAGLVATQLLGLAFCRYLVKLPPVVALTPEQIVDEVGRSVQVFFDGGP
ncbi:TetR family transcriptional regulator [Rhizobium sp. TRM95111]|uniref:TetR/AcrR family transcriptional regulator n=1 Tax=Rhizobium alarense TaxID=2846851 RepID=UPI001F16BF5C|nr:TetR family transcriptional regulator [Rhizobium alarense]MCF3642356.1 TetR family transcriptional regulator [Rhizobium alarense]